MKVMVGMSGGVDSAVAALLLKEQGYDVECLFMRNWDSTTNNDFLGNPDINNEICPQEQDYNDALKVCEALGLTLHRVDFVKEYWDFVFTYFLDELKKGRTPNPDVMCNKYIKFDYFKKEAKRLGADAIATGHYAKMVDGVLAKPLDLNKDQTYFLALTSKKQLQDVLFPLENITKEEVRDLALKHNLPVAKKKDSTGICFIGERNFRNFLKNYLPIKKGNIVDIESKKIIGSHDGLMNYTIGQRKGMNVGGIDEGVFVVGKDLKDNTLYVAKGKDNPYLYSDEAILEDINLFSDLKENCFAKFRYRQEDNPVTVSKIGEDKILVKYPQQIKAVTPGQICVLYDENGLCLGGGVISKIKKDGQELWYL